MKKTAHQLWKEAKELKLTREEFKKYLKDNGVIVPLGKAKKLHPIEIGLFIFERGWNESEIIYISDTSKIEILANFDFFNGTFKRFNFNKQQKTFETGLLNFKDFESIEEERLANFIIAYLKETNVFSNEYVKFEITVPNKMSKYFKELK